MVMIAAMVFLIAVVQIGFAYYASAKNKFFLSIVFGMSATVELFLSFGLLALFGFTTEYYVIGILAGLLAVGPILTATILFTFLAFNNKFRPNLAKVAALLWLADFVILTPAIYFPTVAAYLLGIIAFCVGIAPVGYFLYAKRGRK